MLRYFLYAKKQAPYSLILENMMPVLLHYSFISWKNVSWLWMTSLIFYCLKCCVQSCNQVFCFLNTDGKTNCVWLDTLVKKLFLCALAVCSCCRMDHQRFYICHICKQGKDCKVINKFLCSLGVSLDLECEDRTAAV